MRVQLQTFKHHAGTGWNAMPDGALNAVQTLVVVFDAPHPHD